MSGRRAGWRLARRMLRRAPGRAALIAALVAIPVVAGALVAVTIWTAQLSPDQAATRYLGRADAVAVVTALPRLDPGSSQVGRGPSYSGATVESQGGSDQVARDATRVDLSSLLPPGTRAVPEHLRKPVTVRAGTRSLDALATVHEFGDPLADGIYERVRGRLPAAADEVALTTALAHRLHAHLGEAIEVGNRHVTVTAIVRDLWSMSTSDVVGSATSLGGLRSFASNDFPQEVTWLLSFAAGRAPELHDALAAHGVIFETRAAWTHPSDMLVSRTRVNPETIAIMSSIALFGLAEIVFLAGTAIAVGTRRQVRELGLLRACGGDESDVRRAVLGQSATLGVIGGALGAAAGVLLFVALRPVLQSHADAAFGPLDVRPIPLAAIALLAVVAALLAAIVPARGSIRMPVVDMIKDRFPADDRPRNPRWAWVALSLGPVVVVLSAASWHHARMAWSAANPNNRDAIWTSLVSVGAAITLAGIARSVPLLLTGLGRHAQRLPLSPRLALRDASRHWHRSAPATAAVATIVAAALMVLVAASSTDLRNRRQYEPGLPHGMVSVVATSADGRTSPGLSVAAERVRAGLRADEVGWLGLVGPEPNGGPSVTVPDPACSISADGQGACRIGQVGVADPTTVEVIAGRRAPVATHALLGGAAIVFEPALVHSGRVRVDVIRPDPNANGVATPVLLPAVTVPVPHGGELPPVVVSADTARNRGWSATTTEALLRPPATPSRATERRLSAELAGTAGIYVERGYQGRLGLAMFILLGASALAALAGTSIAVALAMAESRADMATLAAVGAPPGRRRVHAMAQALTVGTLGTGLGLPLGLLVGATLILGSTSYPLSIPLRWIAILVVAVPALGVAVAGAATRSRVTMTRRLA